MEFIWKQKYPIIKNSTLCNDYKNGGLKYIQKLPMLLDKKVVR